MAQLVHARDQLHLAENSAASSSSSTLVDKSFRVAKDKVDEMRALVKQDTTVTQQALTHEKDKLKAVKQVRVDLHGFSLIVMVSLIDNKNKNKQPG